MEAAFTVWSYIISGTGLGALIAARVLSPAWILAAVVAAVAAVVVEMFILIKLNTVEGFLE